MQTPITTHMTTVPAITTGAVILFVEDRFVDRNEDRRFTVPYQGWIFNLSKSVFFLTMCQEKEREE